MVSSVSPCRVLVSGESLQKVQTTSKGVLPPSHSVVFKFATNNDNECVFTATRDSGRLREEVKT